MTEPRYEPSGSSPDAVLEFLSQHRQGTARGREPKRPIRGRSRKVSWLGIVAAIVVVGGGALFWGIHASHPAASTAARDAGANGTSKGTSRGTAAGETKKTAAHGAAAEPWHRGLATAGQSTTSGHLPAFYYRWMRPSSSCAKVATYGCWKLKVVSRHGCAHGVTLLLDETQGGGVVGAVWGYSGRLAAKKPRIVEVDADQSDVGGQVKSIVCKT